MREEIKPIIDALLKYEKTNIPTLLFSILKINNKNNDLHTATLLSLQVKSNFIVIIHSIQFKSDEKRISPMSFSCSRASFSSCPHSSEHKVNMKSFPSLRASESAEGTIAHIVFPIVAIVTDIMPP